MRILITGGAGFIGSQLGLYLDKKGHEVTLLDNLEYGYVYNFSENKRLVNNFICMDIRDSKLENALENIEVVFHIAGYISLPGCNNDPYKAYSINTAGTANVLEMCRRKNVKKVIFASTSAVYENETITPFEEIPNPQPNLIYAHTKKVSEEICESFRKMYGMDISILRFFNVYGPHMDYRPPSYLISYIIGSLLRKEAPVLHSNGKQARDFVYVSDVVSLCESLMIHSKIKNELFNVGSGKTTSIQEIFDIIARLLGERKIKPTYRNPKLIWEKFPKQFEGKFKFDPELLDKEVTKFTLASIEKAKKLLNWQPKVSIEEGLKKTVDFAKRKLSD